MHFPTKKKFKICLFLLWFAHSLNKLITRIPLTVSDPLNFIHKLNS